MKISRKVVYSIAVPIALALAFSALAISHRSYDYYEELIWELKDTGTSRSTDEITMDFENNEFTWYMCSEVKAPPGIWIHMVGECERPGIEDLYEVFAYYSSLEEDDMPYWYKEAVRIQEEGELDRIVYRYEVITRRDEPERYWTSCAGFEHQGLECQTYSEAELCGLFERTFGLKVGEEDKKE